MPDWSAVVRRRLAAAGEPPDAHPELVDELALHLERRYRAVLADGATPEAAGAAAEQELEHLGPLVTAARRRARSGRPRWPDPRRWMTHLGGDLRQAGRLLRLRPSFSAVIIATLAVGIGACTAVFSVVDAVLFGSMPYRQAERLVLAWEGDAAEPDSTYIVAAPVYEDWRARNQSLASLGIWEFLSFNVNGDGQPEQVTGIRASASLWDVLGVAPALGRSFTPAEASADRRVAVISDALWRSQYGNDASILGRSIRLNGDAYEVIGVMPPTFVFPRAGTSVYVPMVYSAGDRRRDSHSFYVAGRLRAGVTFARAREDFNAIGAALASEFIENRGETNTLTRMSDFGLPVIRTMLIVALGAVAFVLLIGCVNVANLQLGAGLSRRREFAVRMALGASLPRLARQVLLESSVLAVCGGAGGALLGWIGARGLDALVGAQFLTFWFRGHVPPAVNAPVLLFTLATSVACALLFGLAPIVGLRRASPQPGRHDGTRGSTRSAAGARRALVAVEVALAVVVLSGAGLMVKSLAGLLRVEPGLDPAHVITAEVSLPQADPYGPAERASFCDVLAREAAGSAAFTSVGAVSHLPLSGANASRGITIEGRPAPAPHEGTSANYRVSCPGYFRTMGIPLMAGRDFTDADHGTGVVIVNRLTAERYWPGESPIGRRLKIGNFSSHAPWLTIVGVVDNVHHFGLDSDPVREMFVPYGQLAWPVMTVVAKTAGAPTEAAEAELENLIHRLDPSLPVARPTTMGAVIDGSLNWRAAFMRLLSVFAAVGLLLAAVGVYSVLAYFVSQRRRELGVRMALGASRPELVGLVLRQSLGPVVAGLAVGIPASVWAGRLLRDVLFRVTPGDVSVIGPIVALLITVALVASWLPARQAASIDPVVALRDD
jgi:putative ABC transport system permease protein